MTLTNFTDNDDLLFEAVVADIIKGKPVEEDPHQACDDMFWDGDEWTASCTCGWTCAAEVEDIAWDYLLTHVRGKR